MALFAVTPFVVTLPHGAIIVSVIAAAVAISGSYAIRKRKAVFAVVINLSIGTVLSVCLLKLSPSHTLMVLSHACVVLLLAFLCVTILQYVLQHGRVTSDRIFAAICVYLLIGYAWTFTYTLLEELRPGAFAVSPAELTPAADDYVGRVQQFRYFSFVTLTTVGYGDVVARSQVARTMVVLEAIMGQIYLTVLVARLVGLHIVHSTTVPDHE